MIQQPADSLFLIADMLMNHGLCNRYILITDLLDNIIMFTDLHIPDGNGTSVPADC